MPDGDGHFHIQMMAHRNLGIMITINKKRLLKYMHDNDIVTWTELCLDLVISKPTLRKLLKGEEVAEHIYLKVASKI